MLEFLAQFFILATRDLESSICDIRTAIKEKGKDTPPTANQIRCLRSTLSLLELQSRHLGLERVCERIEEFELDLVDSPVYPPLDAILRDLQGIQRAVTKDLGGRVFMSLQPEDVRYYDPKREKQLFGPEVFTNFPSTQHDVGEAGNCYSTGRYTACVFHCMRILEKGLRALVHELNSKHAAGLKFGKPVDEANWGPLIGEIQIALESPKRQKRLNPIPDKDQMGFYSRLSLEFEYFKNAWRDDVAHSRSSYDESEAKSVMNHVEAFMKQIAKRLTELPREADNPLPEN
jgi:HEPN domain-containing protein